MSESFATSRSSGGAEEFERRVRSLVASSDGPNDPLAELARLVGEDDPFRLGKPQIRAIVSKAEPKRTPVDRGARERGELGSFADSFRGAIDAGEEPGAPDDPAVVYARRSDADAPPLPRAPDISPDSWARGADPVIPVPDAPELTATRDGQTAEGGSMKRTLIVLAAVVALTGGGLVASFLTKPTGSGGTAPSKIATPTILAATGPSKVQPETPAADPGAPSEPSTLLDKNKNDGTASAKVVNSVEQPVDLNQAVKPAVVSDVQASSSPFPEPRKVKTVLVRPDGSIITDRPLPAADSSGALESQADQRANLAFDPKTSLPVIASEPSTPVAVPATPAASPVPVPAATTPPATGKVPTRVVATPTGDDASATKGRTVATTPAVKPAVAKVVPKPKPTPETVAAATPPAAADNAVSPAPSGRFAAQLGAAGSEDEAHGLSSTLSRKYPDAVGGRLAVHKAQSGTKTVYRLRVGGLSQDAAKAVCAKVTSGGGACFVARD